MTRHYSSGGRKIRVPNKWEAQFVEEMLAQGWDIYRRGWPDFIAVKGKEIRFVEVKPPDGWMSPHQIAIAKILSEFGIQVECWNGKGLGMGEV